MFKHLLVPLDGSPMAESALPVASALAAGAGAGITLLHVLEASPPASVHGQRHLTNRQEAEDYLRHAAEQVLPPGIPVQWHVHEQPVRHVAASLAEHAQELDQDLVIMCAHGPKRLRDRFLGNLAQQLARRRPVPVLLLRTTEEKLETRTSKLEKKQPFRRVLACVDPSPAHEDALSVAAEVARLSRATTFLLTAVPTSGTLRGKEAAAGALLPGAMREVLDMRQSHAVAFLESQVERLRREGLDVSGRVARGDVAELVEQAAKDFRADLVAVGTHGATGLDALWFGGLPRRLFRRIPASFLLIPVRD